MTDGDNQQGVFAWGAKALRFLGSYGLACVILLLLTLLTFMGTLEQADTALFDVQRDYFESVFLVSDVLDFPVPMPGAYLLLALLFVNLIVGGMLRLKRTWSRAGIFVIHLGVALLLIGGFVEFTTSIKGYLPVYEGEPFTDRDNNGVYDEGEPFADVDRNGVRMEPRAGKRFLSHESRDLVVRMRPDGTTVREWRIPTDRLKAATSQRVTISLDGGPTFEVYGYRRNAAIRKGRGEGSIDGRVLMALDDDPKQAERNMPACFVSIQRGSDEPMVGLVSAEQEAPFVVGDGKERIAFDLLKRGWELPFSVVLRRGVEKKYPGTNMPSEYSSYITMIEDGVREPMHITMNEPLRHKGYTLYQSGMNVITKTRHGPLMQSVFSVVKNPADSIPLVACVIILIGMLIQFGMKLIRYIQRELRRDERPKEAAA